jgi:hypothetical protein
MAAAIGQFNLAGRKLSSPKVKQSVGEVAYVDAFNVADDMTRKPMGELPGQSLTQFAVHARKHSPKPLFHLSDHHRPIDGKLKTPTPPSNCSSATRPIAGS